MQQEVFVRPHGVITLYREDSGDVVLVMTEHSAHCGVYGWQIARIYFHAFNPRTVALDDCWTEARILYFDLDERWSAM
jgi:hypothetical protein